MSRPLELHHLRESKLPFIDTHCHLDFDVFDSCRESLVQDCLKDGLTHLVLPGVTQAGWKKLLDVGQAISGASIAPGLHPCFISQHLESHLEELRSLISTHRQLVVAVGEVGLDFFIDSPDLQKQRLFFEQQIVVADSFDLPLLLHVRKAHDEVRQTIRRLKFTGGGIVHCYSGSLMQAEQYLALGFKIGIGGVITFHNAHRLQKIAATLPLSAFVLETDAPDIPPEGWSGEFNTPKSLPEIVQAFCSHRSESPEQIAKVLYENSVALFPQLES